MPPKCAPNKLVPWDDPDYIARSLKLTELMQKGDPDRLDDVAPWFVALEVEVGPYAGFRHYKILTDQQYCEVTGYSPEYLLKYVSERADEFLKFWKEVGYPFVSDGGYRRAVARAQAIQAAAGRKSRAAIEGAIDRELVRAIKWAQRTLPNGDPPLCRALDRIRPAHARRHDGKSRHAACVTGSRVHSDGSCVGCAIPAAWSYVCCRHPSTPPAARGRVG